MWDYILIRNSVLDPDFNFHTIEHVYHYKCLLCLDGGELREWQGRQPRYPLGVGL